MSADWTGPVQSGSFPVVKALMVVWIWREMYGNGAQIGMMKSIIIKVPQESKWARYRLHTNTSGR